MRQVCALEAANEYAAFLEGFDPAEPVLEDAGSGDEFYTGADGEAE